MDKSGQLLKVNIISKNVQIILVGEDCNSNFFTYLAKSMDSFLVKSSNDKFKILDYQFNKLAEIKIENRIIHILHLFNNLFLILTKFRVYKFYIRNYKVEKIQLNQAPKGIQSGTTFKKELLFLHVLVDNENHEGRFYDLHGNIISRITISKYLK